MTIDLDAYGFAASSLTSNDPVPQIPFANRLTTHGPTVTYLRIKLLGNNFHLRLERAVLTLGVLLFKLCLACSVAIAFLQLRQPQNHKISGRAPIDALFLHST